MERWNGGTVCQQDSSSPEMTCDFGSINKVGNSLLKLSQLDKLIDKLIIALLIGKSNTKGNRVGEK